MILITLFKALRKVKNIIVKPIYSPCAYLLFYLNGADISPGLIVHGFLTIHITRRGKMNFGKGFSLNSGLRHNLIGRQQNCIFWVEGDLKIGNNVGMSSTAIICNYKITIGNNVVIGGNTVIYDSDFHHLDPLIRNNSKLDKISAGKAAVFIGDNVFIGAHTTILKGVVIGKNAVIGACSTVTKNIGENEVWAGNPARFIKFSSALSQ